MSESVSDILGFDKDEVIGTPAFGFCHPEDAGQLYRAYQEMISEDKAACLLYLRVKHKDPRKGALLSSVSCSRVGQHIIGAVSLASSATKAMHNASTAQEVIVIAPSAAHLEFRRWNDPPPIPPSVTTPPSVGAPGSPVSRTSSQEAGSVSSRESSLEPSSPPHEPDELSQSFVHLTLSPPANPGIAKRVAFVLNRFSINVPITYSSNDDIIPRSLVVGRSFYDFVTASDESRIRKAMDAVKGWGVNERGHPSDGGFAFNRFHLQLKGRDSSVRPDPAPHRSRRTPHSDTSGANSSSRDGRAGASPAPAKAKDSKSSTPTSSRNRIKQRTPSERGVNAATRDTQLVDAIFSPQSDGIIVIIRPALQTA